MKIYFASEEGLTASRRALDRANESLLTEEISHSLKIESERRSHLFLSPLQRLSDQSRDAIIITIVETLHKVHKDTHPTCDLHL